MEVGSSDHLVNDFSFDFQDWMLLALSLGTKRLSS